MKTERLDEIEYRLARWGWKKKIIGIEVRCGDLIRNNWNDKNSIRAALCWELIIDRERKNLKINPLKYWKTIYQFFKTPTLITSDEFWASEQKYILLRVWKSIHDSDFDDKKNNRVAIEGKAPDNDDREQSTAVRNHSKFHWPYNEIISPPLVPCSPLKLLMKMFSFVHSQLWRSRSLSFSFVIWKFHRLLILESVFNPPLPLSVLPSNAFFLLPLVELER